MKRIAFWITILFSWTHPDASSVVGYNLYKGPSADKLVKVATTQGSGTEVAYDMLDASPQVFGVSAFNKFGESSITTTDASGVIVKLGKPSSPAGLSYSVK